MRLRAETWLADELQLAIWRAVNAKDMINRFPASTLEQRMAAMIDQYYPFLRGPGDVGYSDP